MTDLANFAAHIAKAPAKIKAADARMVAAGALSVTAAIRAEIASATHGSNRLRGVGANGAAVGAAYTVKGSSAIVYARGPLHLLERDTAKHSIAPRRSRGKRALGSKGRGFGPVASVAQGGGSKGKHPFARGAAASLPALGKAVSAELAATLAEVVGGV